MHRGIYSMLKPAAALISAAALFIPAVVPAGIGQAETADTEVKEIELKKDVAGNPIVTKGEDGNTVYGGDPAVLVDGDTVYAYMGHDMSTDEEVNRGIYHMTDYLCYSTKDMKTWKAEGSVFKTSTDTVPWVRDSTSAWASQTFRYKDKYYLYYCSWDKTSSGKQSIGVAVAVSPSGPFVDKGEPVVKGTLTEPQKSNWDDIDPTVWVETDSAGVEHRYLAWGNSNFYICELNEDMVSVKDRNGDGQITCGLLGENADIINNNPAGFTEAPWIYRRKDKDGKYTGPYYLFYASGWRERMAYSTTDDLMGGKWTFGKVVMGATATSNTNHMAVFDFQGKTYFMHHNGSQPAGNGYRRIPCVREMFFEEDGSVREMEETASGLTGTTSVLYTNSGALLEHEYFTNSTSDKNYPYVDKKLGVGIGKNETDSQWLIMAGKSDPSKGAYVSIQSENKPGLYVTAGEDGAVLLAQDVDAKPETAARQTFRTVLGLSSTDSAPAEVTAGTPVSFESVAYPGRFLTMMNGVLSLSDGTDTEAATFYLGVDANNSSLRSIAASVAPGFEQVLQTQKKTKGLVQSAANNLKKGVTVTVAYADGTTETVTNYSADLTTVNQKKVGRQGFWIQYTDGGITKKTMAFIEVVKRPGTVQKLNVKTTVKKKKMLVELKWKKAACAKYELTYGKKITGHKKLGVAAGTKKAKSYKVSTKKIKPGKSYYFHIRPFVFVNGKKEYGEYRTVQVKC